jgi:hypothetical protein
MCTVGARVSVSSEKKERDDQIKQSTHETRRSHWHQTSLTSGHQRDHIVWHTLENVYPNFNNLMVFFPSRHAFWAYIVVIEELA